MRNEIREMTLSRSLTTSIAVQSIGAVATLLIAVVVSRNYGPAGQGFVAYIRSIIELGAVVAGLGLPQAVVYVINKRLVDCKNAFVALSMYAALAAVVLIAGTVFCSPFLERVTGLDSSVLYLASIATSAATIVLLYRAYLLAAKQVISFNTVTILPPVAAVVGFILLRDLTDLGLASVLAAANLAAMAAAAFLSWSTIDRRIRTTLPSTAVLKLSFTFGLWSFVSAAALHVTTAGGYWLIQQPPHGAEVVGFFSIGVLLIAALALPLNMVVPVLLRHWSAQTKAAAIAVDLQIAAKVGAIAYVVALILTWSGAELVILPILGAEFSPAVLPLQILMISLLPLYLSRLLSTALLAVGAPLHAAVSAVVRCVVTLAPIYLGLVETLPGVAFSWVVGEVVGTLYLLWAFDQHQRRIVSA